MRRNSPWKGCTHYAAEKIYCRVFQARLGLDALTHAVETYIGRFYNTRETRSLARQAVEAIYRMNRALGIPERFPCIRPEDLPQMAAWAEAEANPVYPVPVIFGKEDFIRVARRVMP